MTTATLYEVTTGSIQRAKKYNNPDPFDRYAPTARYATDSIDYNKGGNPTGGTSGTTSTTGKKPAVNPESTANVHPLTNEQNPENIIVKLLNQMFATQDPKERQKLLKIAFKEAEAEPGLLASLAEALENIFNAPSYSH